MTAAPTVLHGDVLDVLPTLADASIDAVVCDPPYALGFMGHDWDTHTPQGFQAWCQAWAAECLRVLRPGGHLLAFGGTRTVHRLTSGIEDAGLEVRDGIDWLYGSGFPKSLDVSKAIDRTRDDRDDILAVTTWLAEHAERAGVTRAGVDEHMGTSDMGGWWLSRLRHRCALPTLAQWDRLRDLIGFGPEMDAEVWRLNGRKGTPGNERPDRVVSEFGQNVVFQPSRRVIDAGTPVLDEARAWEGWGTALKPAREPIVVARKPLDGTVAANVVRHGTGALNIDACRIEGVARGFHNGTERTGGIMGASAPRGPWEPSAAGRWPTNVVLSHVGNDTDGDLCADGCVPGCPVAALDEQSGDRPGMGSRRILRRGSTTGVGLGFKADVGAPEPTAAGYGDTGGASRFYPVFRYQAKAPARERPKVDGVAHSTVKPLALMRWLVTLVTPPGGHVLDPFAGSGTTVEACLLEGFTVTAVEKHGPYLPLISARVARTTGTPSAS